MEASLKTPLVRRGVSGPPPCFWKDRNGVGNLLRAKIKYGTLYRDLYWILMTTEIL